MLERAGCPAHEPSPRLVEALARGVIAEVHVARRRRPARFSAHRALDHYRDAGFTVIELMPSYDFPGRRNWGYDGVLLYAPDRAYGTPDDLRALIDAAHERGLGVMLDVVYNHSARAELPAALRQALLPEDISTPWVRRSTSITRWCGTSSARTPAYWLADFGFDGLRFDAVHALATDGAKPS